ncbi:hypothetical protein PPYR_00790 [Photinus pyralis]|uniref:DDE Tnp4 domain-containing protein n=1 Tax=Photinus pyralis TaxID=7054 RepID=A0A5N4B343_PHOPY|nr:hypothetical protein PPYR_00790 [Photinus pyralis]
MALCDAHYCFTLVDVGAQGRQSDGGIFKNSAFGKQFYNREMNLPMPQPIYTGGPTLPFVIVADEAFQLTDFLLRPYPGRSLSGDSAIYNYRHSRARRTIENTFGILTAKWRIFRRAINVCVETAEFLILATVCLHNFLKKDDHLPKYCPGTCVDREDESGYFLSGMWRQETTPLKSVSTMGTNTNSRNAATIRNQFKEHFISNVGALPWQWNGNV